MGSGSRAQALAPARTLFKCWLYQLNVLGQVTCPLSSAVPIPSDSVFSAPTHVRPLAQGQAPISPPSAAAIANTAVLLGEQGLDLEARWIFWPWPHYLFALRPWASHFISFPLNRADGPYDPTGML